MNSEYIFVIKRYVNKQVLRFSHLTVAIGSLVSVNIVSYSNLNLNAKDSRIALTTWALSVLGVIPIIVVTAVSSLIGA